MNSSFDYSDLELNGQFMCYMKETNYLIQQVTISLIFGYRTLSHGISLLPPFGDIIYHPMEYRSDSVGYC